MDWGHSNNRERMEIMASQQKAKAWTGILYLEHLIKLHMMRPADMLGKLETLQGFVSPLHTPAEPDVLSESLLDAWEHSTYDATPKPHLHVCIVYGGRTTEHHIHALLAQTLGLPFEAIPLMQPVQDVANLARYFEHKTDAAKGKQQFSYGNAFFGGFSIEDPHAMVNTAISVARKLGDSGLHIKSMRDIMLSEAFTSDEKAFVISHAYFVRNL